MTDPQQITRRSVLGAAAALGATAGVGALPDAATAAGQDTPAVGRPGQKVALITGTSSGFGRLTALTLARAGHRVFASMRESTRANARSAGELRTAAHRERLSLEVVDIDVRDDRSVQSGVDQVRRRAGRIDVLVNNAGTVCPGVLETMTAADVQRTFETNLFGHLRMNRAVLPAMRAQRDGLVVQVTTALGRFVFPFLATYCGAKWALEAMTEATRYEVSRFGVDVVILEPGAYSTDFVDPNGVAYYRRYLRDLSPADARRLAEYGDLARRAESHLVEDSTADPQEVADAVATIVDTARGQRPVRVLGPGLDGFLGELNSVAAGVQTAVLEAAGFADLATAPPPTR
ncbi:SDR family oxidoreductase [Plantactinospora sp. KLBMP9567]|uniref:SDR family oxidoreductase n=1 Tax=Plantactinospora sp. KLBMP9567 TaxID=3085900 RepID=UPI002981F81C|nr:SDR family oxidoreductase [Plantactinospora sp. KLBMP9567]MDW5322425.1 SDR family oxidoreductase [Plantactinospora sp. KLBMP9567]